MDSTLSVYNISVIRQNQICAKYRTRLTAGDEVSWQEFYDTYRKLILLCGQDCSLTPSENDELVQLVMCEIFQKDIVGKFDPDTVPENLSFKYDPAKGRFRHYFKRIIRNQAINLFHRRDRFRELKNEERLLDEDRWNRSWDEEWKKHVLNMALTELKSRVQSDTFLAFEMYAIQHHSVEEVAEFLNLSVSSVYSAKSRCITALKEIINDLEEK